MEYTELNQLLGQLDQTMYALESAYVENGGEVTEETESLEANVSGLQELLCTEGVDMLGRWLKSKEDMKKTLKAEKDYIARKIAAVDDTIEFIKAKLNEVIVASGQEKVKGSLGYSFTATTSVTTTVDKAVLKDMYQSQVEDVLRDILPADVTVTLGASVKAVPEGVELPSYYQRSETPTVRFTKPRAAKED